MLYTCMERAAAAMEIGMADWADAHGYGSAGRDGRRW
jgi:hypothetical protein